ncbi:IS66 family insertion sequence element accessory protein TnpB [Agrobacterium sp. DSM 25558]|uniref:IS66 family insertion sequence element accessory protein TnpB n=1 Tax=Agrobacterium sp. DSM 25558 TaxID=1907665 RepID=UPI00097DF49D|nr:IS66 family insertion sequence element accessory protein TnpB [Agrobacterium sp. DSM 25558]
MIGPSGNVQVYLACGVTDMRRGIDGLSTLVEGVIRQVPGSGAIFGFRSRLADRIKLLWWDDQGFCLFHKSRASIRISVGLQFSVMLNWIDKRWGDTGWDFGANVRRIMRGGKPRPSQVKIDQLIVASTVFMTKYTLISTTSLWPG